MFARRKGSKSLFCWKQLRLRLRVLEKRCPIHNSNLRMKFCHISCLLLLLCYRHNNRSSNFCPISREIGQSAYASRQVMNWWDCEGGMPVNVDNLSATGKEPTRTLEEPTVFMIRSEVEVMRRENERASVSSIFMNQKPPFWFWCCSSTLFSGNMLLHYPKVWQ